MNITPEELARLKNNITPGEWKHHSSLDGTESVTAKVSRGEQGWMRVAHCDTMEPFDLEQKYNAQAIALLPQLLAEVIQSRRTPQQEGGLTRDAGSSALYTANLRIDQLERELSEKDLAYRNAAQSYEEQLAEAKKGRYAIGEEVEFRYANHSKWVVGTVQVYDGEMHQDYTENVRPLPIDLPIPTVEQMIREWKAEYRRKFVTPEEEMNNTFTMAIIEFKGDMAALWRRDCKGGVK